MKGRKQDRDLSVVASVQQQTEQAAALAAIAGQERLTDPRLNPATRGHADALRNEQQIRALDAAHSRALRRHRVTDRQAADAEEALQAVALARQATSPARSVLALHRGKRRYLRLSLAASVVCAVGSAMGVEAAAEVLGAPGGSGYIAEVGLTGLATAAITYRAHLAEHRGKLAKKSWQSRALWALMTVPLLVSVACNLATLNAVGAFCAISAAAFSLLSCVIADRSAEAMQDRASEVSDQEEAELRATAMGDDPFAAVQPEQPEPVTFALPDPAEDEQAEPAGYDRWEDIEPEAPEPWAPEQPAAPEQPEPVGSGLAEEVSEWLAEQDPQDPPEGVTSSPTTPDGDSPQGAARDVPGAGESMRPRGHIEAEQGEPAEGREGASRVLPAAQARRAVGASTRQQVATYQAKHPGASVGETARALGLSPATVKRHRRELRNLRDGGRS